MPEWFNEHRAWLEWVGPASLLLALASLVLIPILVTRIPADYFLERRAPRHPLTGRHPVVRALFLVARTVAGGFLVLVGVAMLVLPGQGLLTIAVGIILLEFPGKRAMERWLVRKPVVRRPLDWIRRKRGKEPLRVDEPPATRKTR